MICDLKTLEEVREWLVEFQEHHTLTRSIVDDFDYEFRIPKVENE